MTHGRSPADIARSAPIEGSATSTIEESTMTMAKAAHSRASAFQRRGSGCAVRPVSMFLPVTCELIFSSPFLDVHVSLVESRAGPGIHCSDRLEPLAGQAQQGRFTVLLIRGDREDGARDPGGVERRRPVPGAVGGRRGLPNGGARPELERGQGYEPDPESAGFGGALEVA